MSIPLDLSLIVPCYNESTHIRASVKELMFTLKNTRLNYEIVFIDDCSTDNTAALLDDIAAQYTRIIVRKNPVNLGRGATVSRGFRESEANVVGFIDIDLSTQPVYVPYLTQLILDDIVDVATCHRSYKIELSVLHLIFVRLLISYSYKLLSRLVFRHGLSDTETGFKFFQREKVLPLLDMIYDTHWFWDTEIMTYSVLTGLRIREVKSIFIRAPEKPSTVKMFKDIQGYIKNMIRFKKKLRSIRRTKLQKYLNR